MSVEEVRALIAAFSGDDAWRRIKAQLQRRDRYGKFAEMGGGFSFNLRLGNGDMRRVSGKIVGQSGEEDLDIEVKDSDTLPDDIYSIPSSKGEAVKAILPGDALKDVDKENTKNVADDVFVDVADLKVAKKKKKPKQQDQEQDQQPKTSRNPFKRGDSRTSKVAVKNPKNADLAFADENGFLEQRTVPVGVEVTDPKTGEKINLVSREKSITFLKNGGAISEVPDEFVIDAINENTGPRERFNQIGYGGGVNGMNRMIDNVTGAYIGTKYESGESTGFFMPNKPGLSRKRYSEAVNEMFSEIVAEHLGFEPMPMRLVKSRRGEGVSLVTELAQNRWGKVTSPIDPETLNDDEVLKADVDSFARMLLLDSLLGNLDRNPGNYLLKKVDDEQYEIVPIDHSLTMLPEDQLLDAYVPDYTEGLSALKNKVRDSETSGDTEYEQFLDVLGDFLAELANLSPDVLTSKIEQIFDHLQTMFPNEELFSAANRSAEIDRMLGTVLGRIAFMLQEPVEEIAQMLLTSSGRRM